MKPMQRLVIAALIIPFAVILDQWSKAKVLAEPRFNALGCLDGTEYCGKILARCNLMDLCAGCLSRWPARLRWALLSGCFGPHIG